MHSTVRTKNRPSLNSYQAFRLELLRAAREQPGAGNEPLLRRIEQVDPSTHSMETSNGSVEASTGSLEARNELGGGTNEQAEGSTCSMDRSTSSLEPSPGSLVRGLSYRRQREISSRRARWWTRNA
jgi:hypothetical protein